MKIMLTGGAGFIGSALALHLLAETEHDVLNYDALTYAGNPMSLKVVESSPRYRFVHGDIRDAAKLDETLSAFAPDVIINLAAESHVDRSIDGPAVFIDSNVIGTFTLLQAARKHYEQLSGTAAENFRFHHVSTDEVYGALGPEGFFTEETPYAPNSPYSASKAASDHLVRAWGRTYGLPVIISNCSNNYGPRQFPEKLIPLIILNALAGRDLPVYGDGSNVRDWLYVEDHARALTLVATQGRPDEKYNIGGHNEIRNIEVVETICALLDEFRPRASGRYRERIRFVTDRPGHDFRYAIDSSKIELELGWRPRENFESGLKRTIRWYLENEEWWRAVQSGAYLRQGLEA